MDTNRENQLQDARAELSRAEAAVRASSGLTAVRLAAHLHCCEDDTFQAYHAARKAVLALEQGSNRL